MSRPRVSCLSPETRLGLPGDAPGFRRLLDAPGAARRRELGGGLSGAVPTPAAAPDMVSVSSRRGARSGGALRRANPSRGNNTAPPSQERGGGGDSYRPPRRNRGALRAAGTDERQSGELLLAGRLWTMPGVRTFSLYGSQQEIDAVFTSCAGHGAVPCRSAGSQQVTAGQRRSPQVSAGHRSIGSFRGRTVRDTLPSGADLPTRSVIFTPLTTLRRR